MYKSLATSLLISFLLLAAHLTPVLGISVSYTTGDGGKVVSSSENFNMDDTASLREATMLDSDKLYQTRQAAGSGSNSIKQQLSGNGYTVENSIDSVGALSVAASAAASSESADLSQQVAGAGELRTSIQGTKGADSAGQEASVAEGVLSSSQSIFASAGDGVSAAQATKMTGVIGQVSSGAISQEKAVLASGSFLGSGTLEAVMSAQSERPAKSQASMAVDGVEWLKQSDLDEVSQEGVGMAVEGLRLDDLGSVGSFAMQAASMDRVDYEKDKAERTAYSDASGAGSEEDGVGSTVMYLNNPNAYVLAGWRWNNKDPQIKMYLKKDANFLNEGLDAEATKRAIEAAANTWDNAVPQNLFADSNLVTVTEDPNIKADTGDGYNVHAWKPITEGLAYSRTRYYTTKVDGYYSAFESDIVYDSDYQWATDGRDIDVQSVALHEMGHTIGLGDLYGKPEYASDTDEIMHYYDAPQHTLGVGDLAGVQKLYGAQINNNWQSLGGSIKSNPFMIEDTQGRTHIFALGGDNALWDNVDGTWRSLGGYLTSDPYAIVDQQGRVHIFAQGSDHGLWDYVIDTSSGNAYWRGFGGYITSSPSATIRPNSDCIDIAVRGGDNALWMKDINVNSMAGLWYGLGGSLASGSDIIYDDSGKLHAFVRGSDGALWDNRGYFTSGGAYSNQWFNLGGYLTSEAKPIRSLNYPGHLLIFARGGDSALWSNDLNINTMQGNWIGFGGSISASGSGSSIYKGKPEAIASDDGNLHVFVRGGDGALWDNSGKLDSDGVYGNSWVSKGGYTTSDLSALNPSGIIKVAARGGDSSLVILSE